METQKLSPEYIHWAQERLKALTAAIKEIEDVVNSGTEEELAAVNRKYDHFASKRPYGLH